MVPYNDVALPLGSCAERRAGSSPVIRTSAEQAHATTLSLASSLTLYKNDALLSLAAL